MHALYKCIECKLEFASNPGYTNCLNPACDSKYFKWLNYSDKEFGPDERPEEDK